MRMSQVFYSFTGFLYRYVQQIKNLFLYTALTGGFYYYDLNECVTWQYVHVPQNNLPWEQNAIAYIILVLAKQSFRIRCAAAWLYWKQQYTSTVALP